MEHQDLIVYEQPANEHIRVFLRLEHLHNKALYFLQGHSQWESRACMSAIVEILHLLDRPDLRNKITQEVSRQLSTLKRLQQTPQVDHSRLNTVIQDLDSIHTTLHQYSGKFGDNLRNSEFIKSISHHHTTPGGTCAYNTPGLHYWLEQTPSQRTEQLANWLDSFSDLFHLMRVMMNLIRESAMPAKHTAEGGFYQSTLDPQAPCQLIRVEVPMSAEVFPKISLGRHGISIRFLLAGVDQRAVQTEQDIDFHLACCIF